MISKMNTLSSQKCKTFPFEVLYFKLEIKIHEYRKNSIGVFWRARIRGGLGKIWNGRK